MSAMGFPASPTNGDVYRKWTFNGTSSIWELTAGEDINVTYGSAAPVVSGVSVGDEFFVSSDGTSAGVISAGYIWNGVAWTEQLTNVDGSPDGGSTEDF